MKTKLFTFLLFLGFGISTQLSGQAFKSAVGVRFGYPSAISYKTFISESNALEFYGGIRFLGGFGTGINLGAGYQIHKPIASVSGLDWYYGLGASANIYSYNNSYIGAAGGFGLGINGFLGLQYTFADIPLTISSDWTPTFYLGNGYYGGFGGAAGGFAARYILNSGK